MGWKRFKEYIGITNHIVQITDKGLTIGSGYIHDLLTIDLTSGEVKKCAASPGFMKQHYPLIEQLAPAQLLALIQEEDTFEKAITVYTYKGSKIIEKLCEEPGYPDTTHDGELMYENTFSTDKNTVVSWAKSNAQSEINGATSYKERMQKEVEHAQTMLDRSREALATLNAQFPDVQTED